MKKQLTLRLFRFGRKHSPKFRLGVSQGFRHPSKGNAIEFVGFYDPNSKETKLNLERINHYLALNIELSDSVKSLLKKQQVIK